MIPYYPSYILTHFNNCFIPELEKKGNLNLSAKKNFNFCKTHFLIEFHILFHSGKSHHINYHPSMAGTATKAIYDFFTINLFEKCWKLYEQEKSILLDSESSVNLWILLEESKIIEEAKILINNPKLFVKKRKPHYLALCQPDNLRWKKNLFKSYSPYWCIDEPYRTAYLEFWWLINFAKSTENKSIKLAYENYLKAKNTYLKVLKSHLTETQRVKTKNNLIEFIDYIKKC